MIVPAAHPFRSPEARQRYLAHYDLQASRWPMASEERMVPTPLGRTFVRIGGARAAPPLVLLPGMNAHSLMWMGMVEDLSRTFRTFAVDNVNDYGRSVRSSPIRHVGDFCRWIDGLLDGLDLPGGVHLAGASYGAWLASEYALRRPERLERLVLLAPAGAVVGLGMRFVVHMLPSMFGGARSIRRFMEWLMRDLARQEGGAPMLEAIIDDAILARACYAPWRPVPPRVLKDRELAGLRVPVLFLVGENERLFPPGKAVRRLQRVAPAVRTRVLPGCGHDLFLVQAEAASRAIVDFLREGRGPATSTGPDPDATIAMHP